MGDNTAYVKAYICECGCAWTVEKQDPETCWACNSHGPHTVSATTTLDPKFLKMLPDYTEQILFGPAHTGET